MKRSVSMFLVLAIAALSLLTFATAALAEEKMVGVVTKIELAADGKSADVALKDNKSGKEISVVVTDDLTLDKFKDHRIGKGDEVRVKYDAQGGKNMSKYFRKTAGC